MKYYKPLLFALLILAAVFVLSSCDGDKTSTPTYTVQVPQFAEGNNKDAKVGIPITAEVMEDEATVKRFFAYRVTPPITGFKEQKIANGSKIKTSLFGNPITLTMTVDSDGDYIFEGSNDSEYIKVEISKDNTTFDYVHALILDVVDVPGAEDEFDVVEGHGEILSENEFDSYGTAYYCSAGRVARYKFLLHGNDGKMAWLCYEGKLKDVPGDISFTKASDYRTKCVDIVDEGVESVTESDVTQHVVLFDESGLNYLSFDNINSASDLTVEEKKGLLNMMGQETLSTALDSNFSNEESISFINNLEVTILRKTYALVSNGIGKDLDSSDCVSRINGWTGFSDWIISTSFDRWNITQPSSPK